jgi:hypothetical protein
MSFSILRTNVGLTTNIKIMVDSNYKLSLDSINSDVSLSFDKYKNIPFTKNNYYDELISYFYDGLSANIAYKIRYDNDVETMSSDFSNQYDELYQCGARNIVNNKNYKEEYEYFAPLYIDRNKLPTNFIVFRVDGSGIENVSSNNFTSLILNKLKTVKLFSLTKESILGEWLNLNFIDNKYFTDSSLEIDFRSLEFCRWNGIDFKNGGYTTKSLFIDSFLNSEKEIFEFERFIFDSYKNNKVVFPNILNLTFLFDDSPSTPDNVRKWSLNRYYGFYLDDMELVKTMSPYITPILKEDFVIGLGGVNVISTPTSNYPFLEEWSDKKPFYVEYDGIYYKVVQFIETVNQISKIDNITSERNNKIDVGFRSSKPVNNNKVYEVSTTNTKSSVEGYSDITTIKYKILSEINLLGKELELNNNFGKIVDNRLVDYDFNDFKIDNFSSSSVSLIEIDGIYHNLTQVGTSSVIKLISDYSFNFSQNEFSYTVAGVSKTINTIVDFDNSPKVFNIYNLKFTDIKDFDDRIIDTEFSKYEYESESNITNTDETKMYFEDLTSNSYPTQLDDFIYKNSVVNIPVSSEYTANYETFKIVFGELSDIWRKNSVYCRWGFQNSLSANDYSYPLNNSLIFEDYNRTANVSDPNPKRSERNLDYFYSINSDSPSYVHHTLHIERLDIYRQIDNTFKFELDKYLNIATYGTESKKYNFDYFNYLFTKRSEFYDGKIIKNTNKYSLFNVGDDSIPNNTLFRGIKFEVYNIDSTVVDFNNINKINTRTSNDFIDYKFSILLSDTDMSVSNEGLTSSVNKLTWDIIENWNMDATYSINSSVIFDDILYTNSDYKEASLPTTVDGFISYPNNQSWTMKPDSIFWNPNSYTQKYVYNSNEYYYDSLSTGFDFWNPNSSGYDAGKVVLYKNKYYTSLVNINKYLPNEKDWSIIDYWKPSNVYVINEIVIFESKYYKSLKSDNNNNTIENSIYWLELELYSKWMPISLWNPSILTTDVYVIHNDTLWSCVLTEIILSDIPGVSDKWKREYSLIPDTDFNYNSLNNSIIDMNNTYYLCTSDVSDSTLDNKIIIYINQKWKNILININIADNTYSNISEANRDSLYTELYRKLSAANFIDSINDITNKYGFSDSINYVIIDESGAIKKYDITNIKELPYLLKCSLPDRLDIKVRSLIKNPILSPNSLSVNNKLENGKILDISQLNYYNNVPVGCDISNNLSTIKAVNNYHGSVNILNNILYRHSGNYTPIFHTIPLFERIEFTNAGNYKFDTTLSNFGIMKERKIGKINRNGSILKLKDDVDEKSIYPMLDEFGYSVYDFFIFSSTWDLRYYLESDVSLSNNNYLKRYTTDENLINSVENNVIKTFIPNDIGQINK